MEFHSSKRYGLRPAPMGLTLVQDLLNTHGAGRSPAPDLLTDSATALRWLRTTSLPWSPSLEAVATDDPTVRKLRDLREDLRSLIQARDLDQVTVPRNLARVASVELTLASDGRTRLDPTGLGWDQVISAVLLEVHVAGIEKTWTRLKICPNPECRTAFYDRSRNSSGVWHDVKVCGNPANLRASRARRREATD